LLSRAIHTTSIPCHRLSDDFYTSGDGPKKVVGFLMNRCIDRIASTRFSGRREGHALTRAGYLAVLLLTLLAVSCVTGTVSRQALRNDLGEVRIYLEPLPDEAGRIHLTLGDLAAVPLDGSRVPLILRVQDLKRAVTGKRQSHLASGLLPPGFYQGISLTIQKASVQREDGEAALLIPRDPILVERPFDVKSSKVISLFLSLDPAGLIIEGFRFSPFFSLALPSQELTSLVGYLILPEEDRITVFNRKTMRIVGDIATGRNPQRIIIDQNRGRAYVAVSDDDTVQVLDILRGNIRELIPLRTGDGPRDLALTEDGRLLISANYGSDTVSIIDPIQGVETERIRVGQGPTSVIVNRNGTRAYVTSSLANTLSVIDLSTGILSAVLSMEGTTPLAAALDRDEENLFIISGDSPNLTVLDPATLTTTDKIYIGAGAVSIAIDDNTGLVLVGKEHISEISIVDPSVLMPIDTIRLKGAAGHMTIDRQENALLVLVPGRKLLQKVDLVSKRVMAEMEMDAIPSEVAVVEDK